MRQEVLCVFISFADDVFLSRLDARLKNSPRFKSLSSFHKCGDSHVYSPFLPTDSKVPTTSNKSTSWVASVPRIPRPRPPSASTTTWGLFLVPEGTRSRSLGAGPSSTTRIPDPSTRATTRPPRKCIRGSLQGFHDASRTATTSERHVPSRSNERRSERRYPGLNGRTR